MKRALLIIAAVLQAGCPDTLEAQTRISKLRVLGVRAEPTELIYTDGGLLPQATLTAIAVEPFGAPVEVRFALCTFIGAPPPTLECPGKDGLDLADAGAHAGLVDLGDPRILAFAAQFDAGTLAGVDAGLAEGIPLVFGFSATADPAQRLDGFGTITLRDATHGPADRNPELLALEIPEPVHAGQTVRLQPVTAPKDDAAKRYLFSFFSTDGVMSFLHSTDITSTGQPADTWTEWTAPAEAKSVRFWVVLRDGRGGTAWLQRDLDVVP